MRPSPAGIGRPTRTRDARVPAGPGQHAEHRCHGEERPLVAPPGRIVHAASAAAATRPKLYIMSWSENAAQQRVGHMRLQQAVVLILMVWTAKLTTKLVADTVMAERAPAPPWPPRKGQHPRGEGHGCHRCVSRGATKAARPNPAAAAAARPKPRTSPTCCPAVRTGPEEKQGLHQHVAEGQAGDEDEHQQQPGPLAGSGSPRRAPVPPRPAPARPGDRRPAYPAR